MNKSVFLRHSVVELSKILMFEFWYDYVKPKYDEKPKLYHFKHKINDIYKDIAEDVETAFDTSNYESDRRLPKGKNVKINWINER